MPYVGSRSHACRVAYDKGTARELLRREGIPVPDSVGLSAQTFRDIGAAALMEHVMHRLGTPGRGQARRAAAAPSASPASTASPPSPRPWSGPTPTARTR